MGIVEKADSVLATSTGQTVGWVLVFAIVLGFFSQADSEVTFLATAIALGMSWMLGASYGRHQITDETGESEKTE